MLRTSSNQEKISLQEKLKVNRDIIITLYQYFIRSRVEGLIGLEHETNNFAQETDFVRHYIKRAVNMMVKSMNSDSYKEDQGLYTDWLLKENKIPVSYISYIHLINILMESFFDGDEAAFFSRAFLAIQHLSGLPYDDPAVEEMLRQLGILKFELTSGFHIPETK